MACHGLKWIHYQNVPEEIERAHMQQCVDIFEELNGAGGDHGLGWYTGRITALQRFLEHIQKRDNVRVCRRIDLARHRAERFPCNEPVSP